MMVVGPPGLGQVLTSGPCPPFAGRAVWMCLLYSKHKLLLDALLRSSGNAFIQVVLPAHELCRASLTLMPGLAGQAVGAGQQDGPRLLPAEARTAHGQVSTAAPGPGRGRPLPRP